MLILQRTKISKRRMTSPLVIPDFDVLEDGGSDCRFRRPVEAIDQFPFQGGKETFRDGIVVAVRAATHAGNNVVFTQQLAVVVRGVLHAAIAVMHQSRFYLSAGQS